MQAFINATQFYYQDNPLHIIRTQAYFIGVDFPLEKTPKRLKNYDSAGADGIFVSSITQVVKNNTLMEKSKFPLNVLAMSNLLFFEVLKDIGVKRIFSEIFFHSQMYQHVENSIKNVQLEINLNNLFI